jgi:hypothetical protein
MTTPQEIVLSGFVGPEQTTSYLYLPFEVPAQTRCIHVRYAYSAAIGSDPQLRNGNTVDIGIFDPRDTDFHGSGFRGWSGSARQDFYIATDSATPGYLPGPIQPGTWSICLGLYKVGSEGCNFKVTVEMTPAEELEGEVEFPPFLKLSREPVKSARKANGWYKGELHCHSYHSDGDSSPREVVRQAEALGLDFLAITDHNTISHQVDLAQIETLLILIPGYEVTTFNGHWNIWGDQNWIDFRILTPEQMADAIQEAVRRGFLVSCNHPRQYGPPWAFETVEGFHCIEAWNGPWPLLNEECLAFWEHKLRAGKRFSAVGGSDNHFLKREHHASLGVPTTYIYCEGEPSPTALLDGLRAGHTFLTESPDGPEIRLYAGESMMGDTVSSEATKIPLSVSTRYAAGMTLEVCGAQGQLYRQELAHAESEHSIIAPVRDTLYVRAQLVSEDEGLRRVHALTNPIYLAQ